MLIAELLAISVWICGQVCVRCQLHVTEYAQLDSTTQATFDSLQDVLRAVLEFVVKLLVANGSMVSFCLRRLVFCLVPPNPLLETPTPGEVWQPPTEQAAVQDAIIKSLADILLLVPTAPKTMLSELSQRMPFKFQSRAAPCMYFRAVYQLSQTPAGDCVRDGLQAAMVDCLLNIDVEIKWQDIADQQAGKLVVLMPFLVFLVVPQCKPRRSRHLICCMESAWEQHFLAGLKQQKCAVPPAAFFKACVTDATRTQTGLLV